MSRLLSGQGLPRSAVRDLESHGFLGHVHRLALLSLWCSREFDCYNDDDDNDNDNDNDNDKGSERRSARAPVPLSRVRRGGASARRCRAA